MTDVLPPARCLIDGRWVTPHGRHTPVVNPFTERAMGSVGEAGALEVDRAVRAAHRTHESWRGTAPTERAALLDRVADLLAERGQEVAALVTDEMGMPTVLAQVTQVQLPVSVLRATAEVARTFPWREEVDGATLLRTGAGVVGAITPWNMPVHQIVAKVAAAVAAGATVVLKASEQTPYDANVVAELFDEAGAPPGLVSTVTGSGPVTGAALAGHPGLARLSFTGSVRAGRLVAGLAAATPTRCALELGGKSPALLLPDCDLDVAVPSAVTSGLVNSGQACNAPTRLLIPQWQLAEATDRIVATVESLVLGDPTDPTTHQGPLVTARQRTSVLERIAGAVRSGGTLLTGSEEPASRTPTGYFVEPTVITGLDDHHPAVREEIFGPVIVVQTYGDTEEAVRLANDSEYGLSAEVWSTDVDAATQVAGRLSVGQVKVNGVRTRARPTVPFGGVRRSGYGRELGSLGIEEFTDVTAVMV